MKYKKRALRRRLARKEKDTAKKLWKRYTKQEPTPRQIGYMASQHYANQWDREGFDISSKLQDKRGNLKLEEGIDEYDENIPFSAEVDNYMQSVDDEDYFYEDDYYPDPTYNECYANLEKVFFILSDSLAKLPINLKVELVSELEKINPRAARMIMV